MAKRFIDTEMWRKNWFIDLTPKMKLCWIYIVGNCDHAGFWDVNFKLMSFIIGENISKIEFDDVFKNKIKYVKNDKILIISFITFQYGVLNENNRAHKSVINLLKLQGAYKGLPRTIVGHKDKDKDKDQDKDKIKIKDLYFYEKLKDVFSNTCARLPKIRAMTDKRKKAANRLWGKNPDEKYWKEVCEKLNASDFCNGDNDRGWVASFDWFIRPDTHIKILEGTYDNKTDKSSNQRLLEKLDREDEENFYNEQNSIKEIS